MPIAVPTELLTELLVELQTEKEITMGLFSRFENTMEDAFEGAASKLFDAPLSPVQIAKKCEKAMRRGAMVGAGKQYAPTLYTVLVNIDDDKRLTGYYPTLAGETETYLSAKAVEFGMMLDGDPLVRFIPDEKLKCGHISVIAETVAAPIVAQLREEELVRYGIAAAPVDRAASTPKKPPLPYVPEDEIDYSINYGKYTFDSRDFEDYRSQAEQDQRDRAIQAAREAEKAPQQAQNQGYTLSLVGGEASDMQRVPIRARVTNITYRRVYDLANTHITLGRGTDNDIVVQDVAASRKHAELICSPQGYWTLGDLGSTNGVQVNGQAISTTPLHDGDVFTIGKTDFRFTLC